MLQGHGRRKPDVFIGAQRKPLRQRGCIASTARSRQTSSPAMRGASRLLEGEMPAGRVHERQQQLPTRGRGEAVLEYAFSRDEPVRGSIPTRAPSDHNPLNRKEYLLQVVRRL